MKPQLNRQSLQIQQHRTAETSVETNSAVVNEGLQMAHSSIICFATARGRCNQGANLEEVFTSNVASIFPYETR